MEDEKQLEIEYKAIQLALDMYDKFARELITALKNTSAIYNRGKWECGDVQSYSYYQGKYDAFGEIAERVQKEYSLIKDNMDSMYFEQPYEGKADGHIMDRNKRMDLIDYIMTSIRYRKNKDMDRILPDEQFRGRRGSHELWRFKGKMADLLEGYGMEGFRLGIINERKCKEPVNEDILVDEYREVVDNAKKDMVFEPDNFAKELAETVIPKEYLENFNDSCNGR